MSDAASHRALQPLYNRPSTGRIPAVKLTSSVWRTSSEVFRSRILGREKKEEDGDAGGTLLVSVEALRKHKRRDI